MISLIQENIQKVIKIMKKSEFVGRLSRSIERMFDRVSDTTKVGIMFSDSDEPNWKLADFNQFLKSEFLDGFVKIYDGLSQPNGNEIDKESFFKEASKDLLEWFNRNNITKEKTFIQCFPYKSISHPGYFDNMSEIIVNRLEQFGKPPLFHKSQDKVIRYGWEPEKLTLLEVKSKLDRNKKLKNLFVLTRHDKHDCLKVKEELLKNMDQDTLENDVRKFLKKIDGWWIYIPKKDSMMIIDF